MQMSRNIIYLILNKQTGHKYIGSTTLAMNKEWAQHIERSKRMSSEPIHKAFREHGVHNFMIREIDECEDSVTDEKLSYWIDKYQPEYNPRTIEKKITPTPEPLPVIKTPPPQRDKSEYKAWGSFTSENRGTGKHSGLRIRGKNLETGVCTDYENARMAAVSVTGVPNTNGNILLAARKGGIAYGHKWQILEDKDKKKAVFGVNKKTEQIEVRYESMAEAVRQLGNGVTGTGLIRSLKNPGRYTWRGYYWFYAR
jgi:group I intron endonuclease